MMPLHKCNVTKVLNCVPVCDGVLSYTAIFRKYSHLQAILWVACDIAHNSAIDSFHFSPSIIGFHNNDIIVTYHPDFASWKPEQILPGPFVQN